MLPPANSSAWVPPLIATSWPIGTPLETAYADLKAQSSLTLIFCKPAGETHWICRGGDAVEVSFCLGVPLCFRRNKVQIGGESVSLDDDAMRSSTAALTRRGNPVAVLKPQSDGSLKAHSWWPKPIDFAFWEGQYQQERQQRLEQDTAHRDTSSAGRAAESEPTMEALIMVGVESNYELPVTNALVKDFDLTAVDQAAPF